MTGFAQNHGLALFAREAGFSAARCMLGIFAALSLAIVAMHPASAQGVEKFDPGETYPDVTDQAGAIDADLANKASQAVEPRATSVRDAFPSTKTTSAPAVPTRVPSPVQAPATPEVQTSTAPAFDDEFADYSQTPEESASIAWADPESGASVGEASEDAAVDPLPEPDGQTYGEDDLIGAAEGVFGKGAEGLARMIEDLLKKEGRPNGYIVGREGGGAFIFGVRYGSGTLHHKVEGQRKVYWTGPSIGFDAGANAGNTFVLVYNLYDSEDLYKRFPSGEGQAYFIGGVNASYMRRGDIVLIPIRLGAGLRLGVNAGYMKFSKKQRWLPF